MSGFPIVTGLSPLASRYDVIFSDVWGVVHNGLTPHKGAGEALTRFRAQGGVVVMISNAPRPAWSVVEQLNAIGVVSTAYDGIVTSGDVTQALAKAQPIPRCYHIGAPKDEPLFTDLPVERVGLDAAAFVICTGLLDDDNETAEDYRETLVAIRKRGLPMLCANPDLVVEKGHKLIPCAGAIAALYEDMGGHVIQAGKPYLPIYAATWAKAAGILGREPHKSRVLAIGDAIRTDIAGAAAFGVDSLFLSGGIHTYDLHDANGRLSQEKLNAFMPTQAYKPMATSAFLVW